MTEKNKQYPEAELNEISNKMEKTVFNLPFKSIKVKVSKSIEGFLYDGNFGV